MRYVEVKHTFVVADEVTDEQIASIVSTMTVQVEEPVVGYTEDSMNELTVDTSCITTDFKVSSPLLIERENGTYYLGPLQPARDLLEDAYFLKVERVGEGGLAVRVGEFRSEDDTEPSQWGTSMLGDEEEAWRYLAGADFGPIDAEYDEDNLRMLLLKYSVDFNNLEPDLKVFIEQNTRTSASLTPEDVASMNENAFAEHHAGGLVVLGRHTDDGRYVKMHDSWGDDGRIVVHAYNPDAEGDDPKESERYYTDAHEAYWVFLHLEEEELPPDPALTKFITVSAQPGGSLAHREWWADDIFHAIEQITDDGAGLLAGHGGDEVLLSVHEEGIA